MIYVGIDPGFTGAIAIFYPLISAANEHRLQVYDMPVLKVGKKTELDEAGLFNIMHPLGLEAAVTVCIEKAQSMPGQGVSSTGRYLIGYGFIRGMCSGLGLPYQLVHPTTWKAKIMRDMPKEKQASVLKCQQLFPAWSAQNLRLVKHHGRADAVLIAYYGKTA